MSDFEYEWGIVWRRHPDELHRGPWTEDQARQWVQEAVGDGFDVNAFSVVRRRVSEWEEIEDGE